MLEKWEEFKKLHGKLFTNQEEEYIRRHIFQKKLRKIEKHNDRYRRGLETYEIGLNQFSDYTGEEISIKLHSVENQTQLFYSHQHENFLKKQQIDFSTALPLEFDWRTKGMVTPVKDQGVCGSCWAFSTTGAIESHYMIYKNSVVILSEQQLLDCVPEAEGCSGGWMSDAFKYVAKNHGINYYHDYPYEGLKKTCRYNATKPKIVIWGFEYLSQPDEDMLKRMLVMRGPVSVAIDGTGNFPDYTNGIYYNPTCSRNTFSHAGVIVGYGSENGQDFWLLKNSWGQEWGLDGYIKIARNRGNHCGIASKASYPVF
ncbi:hypothetical protein Zmor_020169 [Zophobas morio]|uniref:Cathepsin L n=1 Tax=Zophobas morio TaxID=2755281 RepID=A0AA38I7C8_9CUCU|nr:hypothetical protein Zmor_020169 [Zophobas morio]